MNNYSGPAFPTSEEHGFNNGEPGMTLHQYYMAHAPITLDDAARYVRFHQVRPTDSYNYDVIFNTMKVMRNKYADAMCGVGE